MTRYISYGIDLGTTNSCIAKFDGERVHVFQNNDQMSVTPSVVRMEKTGRIIVGRRAYATKMANPANVASEFKRWIGQRDRFTFQSSGKQLSAEELSAEVLKALVEDVRSQTGESLDAAVITVPAAFGPLQCEATSRAASLAGIQECLLLQEPIAAAVAYGITPGSRDQRWLVFDLGGGTFDVAVMSSREGRLSVLEHRGNNHLGGKDIDRLIVERLLMPVLENEFSLPDKKQRPDVHHGLIQRLHLKAEEAKIDLTRNETVIVSFFDLGEDQEGTSIEGEIEISRHQLEQLCAPLLDKCIALCEEAINGARTSESGLDRILLVGGPTQMPIVRKRLQDRFDAKMEHSFDPLTIVAQGAAIHAASVEKLSQKIATPAAARDVNIVLAHESVSSTLQCPVDGRIVDDCHLGIEIRIDAESGHWTSGWIAPSADGTFELMLSLLEGKTCRFWLHARDPQGRTLAISPDSLTIRHGLTMSAPPLPFTISTEIVKQDGSTELEPMFRRGTALPNEATKTFRANKTIRPRHEDYIAIKIWSGEALNDPEANDLAGNLLIKGEQLSRSIIEGSEIEVTVSIDSSRRMQVIAFLPKLNAHFSEDLYCPQRDEEDYSELAQQVPDQIESHFDRLNELEAILDDGDFEAITQVDRLRQQIENLDSEVESQSGVLVDYDPDRAQRIVSEARDIRSSLAKLENKANTRANTSVQLKEIQETRPQTQQLVESFGTTLEKKELSVLDRELERAQHKDDERSLRKVAEGFSNLHYRILFRQDWFWSEQFKKLRGMNYTSPAVAKELVAKGDEAQRRGRAQELKEVVSELWKLLPKDEADTDRKKVMQAGLRRH